MLSSRLYLVQVVECSAHDLCVGSVLAKATPQLGPFRPHSQGASITPGSLRDLLQNGAASSKRFLDEAAARPCKRKRGAELVEVFADGDWCPLLLPALILLDLHLHA